MGLFYTDTKLPNTKAESDFWHTPLLGKGLEVGGKWQTKYLYFSDYREERKIKMIERTKEWSHKLTSMINSNFSESYATKVKMCLRK